MNTCLGPGAAAVQFARARASKASSEVQVESLRRANIETDVQAALELLCDLADLVRMAHVAGTQGWAFDDFLDLALQHADPAPSDDGGG